jgi:hypothetical protein
MAQAPAPAPGQDGEPAPPGGAVPPDWMDDQTWALTAAACVTEDLPEEWDDDPEGSVPADWAVISVAELAAQAEADGAGHQALMARLIAAGVGEGYAHRRGDPPVPGVVSGPGAGFGLAGWIGRRPAATGEAGRLSGRRAAAGRRRHPG